MAVTSWTSEGMVWEANKNLKEISPEYFVALILAAEERWWIRYASKPDGDQNTFQTSYTSLYNYARNYKYISEFDPSLLRDYDAMFYQLVTDGNSANTDRTWAALLDNTGDWDGLFISSIPVIKNDLSTYSYEVPYQTAVPYLKEIPWSWFYNKYTCLNYLIWFKIAVSPDDDSGWGVTDDPFATAVSGFNALVAKNGNTPAGTVIWDVLNNDPSTNSFLKQSSRSGTYSFQTPVITPSISYNRTTYERYTGSPFRGLDNTKVALDRYMYSNITSDLRAGFGKTDWTIAGGNAVETFVTNKLTADGTDTASGEVELVIGGENVTTINKLDVPGGFAFVA